MEDWISQVDFAWIGADSTGAVGIFYISSCNVPNDVRSAYFLNGYNDLTSFIIDDLPDISECKNLYSSNFKQDVLNGLYVFECVNGSYKKRGEPVTELKVSRFRDFKSLIISLPPNCFLTQVSEFIYPENNL